MNRILRSRLALIVLLIVTFVSGGLAGAAGDRLLHADEAPWRHHRDRDKRHGMEELLDRLDLTAQQRTQVERVLERQMPRVEAIWDSCKPRMAAQIDSTRAEIRALLTPAQRVAFDRELEESEARHRERRGASVQDR
jgi:Spy/CpxP family protein refolding chaperone